MNTANATYENHSVCQIMFLHKRETGEYVQECSNSKDGHFAYSISQKYVSSLKII